MKQLVVISAGLLLYMLFPIQITIDRYNYTVMSNFEKAVYDTGVPRARKEGYFSPDNIKELKKEISDKCKVKEEEIVINVTTVPKYRKEEFDIRERIDFSISIPIKELIAGRKLMGVKKEDNEMMYTVKGSVESELLAP